MHYARELFGRRQESVRLWVVRRADIVDLDDPDLLQPPLDRSFKKPGGYVMRDKLAAAREAAGPGEAEGPLAMSADDRRDRPPPVATGLDRAPRLDGRRRVRHRLQRLRVDRASRRSSRRTSR